VTNFKPSDMYKYYSDLSHDELLELRKIIATMVKQKAKDVEKEYRESME
jgi:hypothetical protein